MRTTTILAGVFVLVPLTAIAAPGDEGALVDASTANLYEVVASERTLGDIKFARMLVPASGVTALAQSRIIYLNRKGVTLYPGNDDARTNRSSIVSGTSQVPAWNTSETNWAATVACMKDMFARWDVTVTDQDPGMVPHMEAVFGGSPQNVGMPSGVGGVSPFTQDCAVIENSIVFTFTNVMGNNPQTICEVMAQEVAHSYGLDHEMLASDPMTYLSYNGKRTFKDQTVSCGEYQNRACGIGGSVCRPNQNSVQLLNQRLGLADLIAPMLGITHPADQATVAPGFEVGATATDNVAVQKADLYIDDVLATTVSGPGPYAFPTDAALVEGPHTVRVEASDGRNIQSQAITVTVRIGGGGGGNGDGDGDGDGNGDGGGDDGVGGGCASGREVGLAIGLLLAFRIRRRARA